MKTILKKDIKTPTENGWYLCKYSKSSADFYKNDEGGGCRSNEIDYRINWCNVVLLYWEGNCWLPNPRSFKFVDDDLIIDFKKVPDDFNVFEEEIKVVY